MIASESTSISARLAAALLEWLDTTGHLRPETDLCLIRIVPGLDDAALPSEIVISGQRRWRLAAVEGDFALRVALVDAGETPLVAFTALSEESFQADLRERSALRRVIRPLARQVFAAVVGRDASALDDERFSGPLARILENGRRDRLLDAARQRTWSSTVRDADATALVCAAAFGFDDRYVERQPGELWLRWLREPPLVDEALLALADETLGRRYPLYARVLAAPPHDPRLAFTLAARHDTTAAPDVRQLARDTAKHLLADEPGLLAQLLQPAEAAYVAAGSPDVDALNGNALLLRAAYTARVRRLVQQCRSDAPPTTSDVGLLDAFVYHNTAEREAVLRLARLRRGLLAMQPRALPTTLREFANEWRTDLAWLDRAARRLRETHVDDMEAASTIRETIEQWYTLRDRWNEAFANRLKAEWPSLFATPGAAAPLVVSQILKHVIRPELSRTPTFLIVLDGCDLPTFLEIVDAFKAIGIAPARVDLALSAIPTMTSHARRAIFGGAIPHDGIRDDDRAADASGDRLAFEGSNEFLGTTSRKLFLKGDVGDGGANLARVLSSPQTAPRLVAAVFNDVDDAIASKEHGVLAERTIDRYTPAFRASLTAAFEAGWRIVVTADHGHTPYRDRDAEFKVSLPNARFAELAPGAAIPSQTVAFEKSTGMPYRIAALYRVGQHSGTQHIGYHGGVSLEEMLVPLAVYGKSEPAGPALDKPPWWSGDARPANDTNGAIPQAATGRVVIRPVAAHTALRAELRERCHAALAGDSKLAQMFDRIADAGVLDAAQLAAAVGLSAGRIRPRVIGLLEKLENAGVESPIAIDDDPLVVRWIGPR